VTARVLDGRAVAEAVRAEVAAAVAALRAEGGRPPGLAVVLVGDDPASATYVRSKERAAAQAGFLSEVHRLPADASQATVEALVGELAAREEIDGILVQLPLPAHIDAWTVTQAVPPTKDVDGFTAVNQGLLAAGRPHFVPCTPAGIVRLLDHYEVPIAGARAVVLGRSQIVGRPLAALMLARDATVTVAHSRTRDLPELVREADIVVAAVGRPHFVEPGWVRPGAVVVDVGIHRTATGLVGDVHPGVAEVAAALTPVPGGVGPMTIAMLLDNTLKARRWPS
jgi:methylenetetrahydrofolate dehydrogenase (NADP+)/methenyltetrahydrofolate cyclohydrolase